MKFKPTLWKSIVSLFAIGISNFVLAKSIQLDCIPEIGTSCPPTLWKDFAFEPNTIIVSLTTGLIVYIVWSLFQKKVKKRK